MTNETNRLSAQDVETTIKKREQREIDGFELVKLIKKTLVDRNLPERFIADLVGFTPSYWNSLTNGNRTIYSLSKDKFLKIAEFLGISLVQCYMVAGKLTYADFQTKPDLEDYLQRTLIKMRADKRWASQAPSDAVWDTIPVTVKLSIVKLYESTAAWELKLMTGEIVKVQPAPATDEE